MSEKYLRYAKQKVKTIVEQLFILPYPTMLKIKNLNKNCSLEELVDFSFDIVGPYQSRDEILELLMILDKMDGKVIMEIGTATGGTLFLLSRVASEDATVISIDLPRRRFSGGYPAWRILLYKSFSVCNQRLHLIRANSHNQKTLEKVKNILNDRRIDILFIDGDHSYDGVKRDFEMYSPLVKTDGIIVFHDIVPGPKDNVGGVPEFWQEIRTKYEHREIVKDWSQNGWGLGILFKKLVGGD